MRVLSASLPHCVLTCALLSLCPLVPGCAGPLSLSRTDQGNEQAQGLMSDELKRLLPVGEQVDIRAGRGAEALHVTGRIREWKETTREVVLADCVVHPRGLSRTVPDLARKYAVVERVNVDAASGASTVVFDVTIPTKDIHHIGLVDHKSSVFAGLNSPG